MTIESMFANSGVLGVLTTFASAKLPEIFKYPEPICAICQAKLVNFLNSSPLF